MKKQRLDTLMVDRGLAENTNKALALIMAGEVTVNGVIITKAGSMIATDSVIDLAKKSAYVSRGGIKLAQALDQFSINVTSLIAIDIGASTGGFTDCLLQHGVERVYAIDVGYGQLDYKLRKDSRVVVMDKTNVHFSFSLPEKADLAVIDVSFISVTRVIPNIIEHLQPEGKIVVLLKPQFEAEKDEVGKGGIIKDPLIHARVIGRFTRWMVEQPLKLQGLITSPIAGAEGNKEFLIYLKVF